MDIPENQHLSRTSPVIRTLEWVCLICALILIIIWPLPGTIAARNIALTLGAVTSLVWINGVRPKWSLGHALPLLCLVLVPIWIWGHYLFLPTDIDAQLYDLKGTWFRATLAIIMASGLGMMIAKKPSRILWIGLAMVSLTIATSAKYLLIVWQTHQWVVNDFRFPFKSKFATVYFLMYPSMAAYAILHAYSIRDKLKLPIRLNLGHLSVLAIVVLALSWLNFIAAHALNGILVAGLMGCILLGMMLIHGFKDSRYSPWVLRALTVLVILSGLMIFWQYDNKYEGKLNHLFGDLQVGVQIDKYPQWQRDPNYPGPNPYVPLDPSGRPVNGSTYERTAWFTKGLLILKEHPLGAGFSHLAFRYWMLQENPNVKLIMSHSGWLDYALGLGLPGLILTWAAMVAIVILALRQLKQLREIKLTDQTDQILAKQLIALASIWIIAGCWVLWWPTEVSERECIEYLFFVMALLASLNQPIRSKMPIN